MADLLSVSAVVPLTPFRKVDGVVGWGRKRNADWAARYARLRGLPYFRLEDGFLRSVGMGSEGFHPLGVVVDDLGIYYDATRPSRLELLLSSDDPRLDDPRYLERASQLRRRLSATGLSKYNRDRQVLRWEQGPRRVLVVDQVAGDLSLRFGGAGAHTAQHMLRSALEENVDAEVWLKPHPQGALSAVGSAASDRRVRVVPPGTNPVRLLQQVDRVYVMTSLLGFEALMFGACASVFGQPFYAGWGLTDDRTSLPRRGKPRSVEQLIVAAYFLYTRWGIPGRGRCSVEEVAGFLEDACGPLDTRGFTSSA